jgi:hypothetical protein
VSRVCKFMGLGAFFRLEARPTPVRWKVRVFRNGRFLLDMDGPSQALDDDALEKAFDAAKMLAEQGIWDPGRQFPWQD